MKRVLFSAAAAASLAIAVSQAPQAAPAPQGGNTIVDIAAGSGRFDTLVTLLQATGLDVPLSQPGTYTVFAPTDEAFAKLPADTLTFLGANPDVLEDVLLYHVAGVELDAAAVLGTTFIDTLNGQRIDVSLQGGLPFVDQSEIIRTDIIASNGIIHVIDEVLLPNFQNVLRTAESAQNFSTLLTAVVAADLTLPLKAEGPFTVLAPTNDAFAKIDPDVLASLLDPANKQQLVDLLLYHVIDGRIFSQEAAVTPQVETKLTGKFVRFVVRPQGLFANSSKIEAADIDASNGVIHVIDTVLSIP